MMARRAVLAAPVLIAAAAARADGGVPASGALAFSVWRKGSQIGTNVLRFSRAGNVLQVKSDVQMKVGIGPITLFRYRLTSVETWRDGQFAEIETATDNDGESLRLKAARTADGLIVDSTKLGRQTMPAGTLPLTHWNARDMAAPLFNPQDGKPMKLTARKIGAERVALSNGTAIDATRYSLTGEATIDDWYDSNGVWCALRAVATDGSIIEYRLLR